MFVFTTYIDISLMLFINIVECPTDTRFVKTAFILTCMRRETKLQYKHNYILC